VVGSCAWRTSGGRRRCGACTGRCARGPACRLSPRPRSACGRPAGRPKVGARPVGRVGAAAARPAVGANEHGGPSTRGVFFVRPEEGKGPRFFVGRAPQRAPRTCLHGRRPQDGTSRCRKQRIPRCRGERPSGSYGSPPPTVPASTEEPLSHPPHPAPTGTPSHPRPPRRLRRDARKVSNPPPRDRRAVRAGAVVRHGFGRTRGADRHGRPTLGGRGACEGRWRVPSGR